MYESYFENVWPNYVREEDRFLMTVLVPVEFAVWRSEMAHHKSLRVCDRLKNRRVLEQAYDELEIAWNRVMSTVPAMAA